MGFFQNQSPSYKKIATFWVMSAKQEETRQKRLNILISDSENEMKIAELRRAEPKSKIN
ncbi:MAG: YdeI/OmpD-associated family protein [Bacteroidales bacterium]|nr:YdeI/OmpD-associated family protein [Bacteroidales bacterium]